MEERIGRSGTLVKGRWVAVRVVAAAGIAGAGLGAGIAGAAVAGAGVASAAGRSHPYEVKTAKHTGTSKKAKSTPATVRTAKVSGVGTVLVDAAGYTVYLFTPDKQSKSTCSGSCAAVWHPVTVSGKPAAGTGAKASLLGTVKDADGKTQVTYDKWPLYTFTVDSKPGQATGQGVKSFGGQWWTVTAAGKEAGATSRPTAKRSSAKRSTPTTKGSSGSSSYGGY